jgi:hypothetical protein
MPMEWNVERTSSVSEHDLAPNGKAMLVAASSVAGSSADLAQDVVALALVAIAAGSLAWRMVRSVRHFFAVGGNSVGCGGGCFGCPGSSKSRIPATGGVVSINALTAPNPPSPDGQSSQAGAKSVRRTS